MSLELYELISKRLEQAGCYIDKELLANSDILEYILLERANCLDWWGGEKLWCKNKLIGDKETLYLGHEEAKWEMLSLQSKLEPSLREKFRQTKQLFETRLKSKSTLDLYYNEKGAELKMAIPKEEAKAAIEQSSLIIAAGDLSTLSYEQLIMLEEKLSYYQGIRRLKSFAIMDAIISRKLIPRVQHALRTKLYEDPSLKPQIDAAVQVNLAKKYSKELAAEQARKEVTEPRLKELKAKVAAQLAAGPSIREQELRFNQLFFKLNKKIDDLVNKGTLKYLNHNKPWRAHLGCSPYTQEENSYKADYANVAKTAETLRGAIQKAREEFFYNPSPETAQAFQLACETAINAAKGEFAQFRTGFMKGYEEFNPIFQDILAFCKALVGILAGATVLPALAVEKYSEQGYLGTFFSTKTSAQFQLESFEKTVVGGGGLLGNLIEICETLNPGKL